MEEGKERVNKEKPWLSESMKGNQLARLWTDEDIKQVVKIIRETAPNVAAIVSIMVVLEISQDQYYHLRDTYPSVRQAHDYAKNCIASRAWTQSFEGNGFPNVLTLAIKRHDKAQAAFSKQEAKDLEAIKGDEKIRTQNALLEENKDLITEAAVAAQAIQDRNAKNKQENA